MAGIRSKDTKPEMVIRRALHKMGFRYRLHDKNLPGKPDLIFPRFQAVIFVHGCFWHCHNCHLFKWPSSRKEFWQEKIGGNRMRDKMSSYKIQEAGWRVLTIWECAIKGRTRRREDEVAQTVAKWLTTGTGNTELQGIQDVVNS
jgi:DNA mismatch endonuclease (patch repair protein)